MNRLMRAVLAVLSLSTLACGDRPSPTDGGAPELSALTMDVLGELPEAPDLLFGPVEVLRGKGQPVTERMEISPEGFTGPFVLYLRNGEEGGGSPAASASVSLDGVEIWGANDLKPKFSGGAVVVELQSPSVLEVTVAGKPGSRLSLWFMGTAQRWTSISAAWHLTCGIFRDDAYCWGMGSLGNGPPYSVAGTPTAVSGPQFASVSTHLDESCGLTEDGAAFCWGPNSYGSVGNGTTSPVGVPTAVLGGITFQSVTPGNFATCGVDEDGDGHCWGHNNTGQLGIGTWGGIRTSPQPMVGGLTFIAPISVGGNFACGISEGGQAHCWGTNLIYGNLGNGMTANGPFPIPVSGGQTYVSLATGTFTTCGVTTEGDLYCWGRNHHGQVGDGLPGDRFSPSKLASEEVFNTAGVGAWHACAITTDGRALCWGDNQFGQLGTGDTAPSTTPRFVDTDLRFEAITAGLFHTCAITTDGGAYCWGAGWNSLLGNGGPPVLETHPIRVTDPT